MTNSMTPGDANSPQPSFIAIIDVDDSVANAVLEELTREGIAAYAEPLVESSGGTATSAAAGVRIHVDRSRVPVARAIITSRLPQAGSRFLSPRDTTAPALSSDEVDEAWAKLVQGWEPDSGSADDGRRRGGSGLSERLIRRPSPASGHQEHPISPENPTGPSDGPEPSPGSSTGPRDYTLDHDLLDDADGADRFVPPEPPPLPRPRHTLDIVGWSAAIGGPTLLVANQVLAWGSWLSGIGVAAFMGGFVLLVARMRTERDHDDPGAVV
jgi:hypothetical protein